MRSTYQEPSPPPRHKTETDASSWVSQNRWGKHPKCYKCNSKNVRIEKNKGDKLIYRCKNKDCDVKQFTVFHGTDLISSHLKVSEWLIICCEYNKGIYGMTIKALAHKLNKMNITISKAYKKLEKLNQQGVNLFGEYNPKTPHRRHQKRNKQYDHMKSAARSSSPKGTNKILEFMNANQKGTVKKLGTFCKKGGKRKLLMDMDEFKRKFNTNSKAMDCIINMRWGDNPECPDCASQKICADNTQRFRGFRCLNKNCKHDRFNAFTKTTFYRNKLGPIRVLYLCLEFLICENGISAKELQRRYGHVYCTSWALGHRVRAMMRMMDKGRVKGSVQYDKAFPFKRETKIDGVWRKVILQMIYSPNDGIVYSDVALDKCDVYDVDKFLSHVCDPNGARHVTCDSAPENFALMGLNWDVEAVNHHDDEYGRPTAFPVRFLNYKMNKNVVTTNHLERTTKSIKRCLATHQHVSAKYLILYVSEPAFRHSLGNSGIDIAYRLEHLFKNGAKNGHVRIKDMKSHYALPPLQQSAP